MKNPNDSSFFDKSEEDKDTSDPVSRRGINFLLNSRRQAEAEEQARRQRNLAEAIFGKKEADEEKPEAAEDTEESADTEESKISKKRKQAGRALRRLFKRRRPSETVFAVPDASAAAEQVKTPDTKPSKQPAKTVAVPESESRTTPEDQAKSFEVPLKMNTEKDKDDLPAKDVPIRKESATNPESQKSQEKVETSSAPPSLPPPPRRPTASAAGGPGGPGPRRRSEVADHYFNSATNPEPTFAERDAYRRTFTERRWGAAGDVIAFLAANRISKIGDSRIMRRLKKTETKLEDTVEQTAKLKSRLEKSRIETEASMSIAKASETVPNNPEITAEATTRYRTAEAAGSEPEMRRPVSVAEVIASSATGELINRKIKRSPEIPADEVVKEGVFDRRHEVKDDPVRLTPPMLAGLVSASQKGNGRDRRIDRKQVEEKIYGRKPTPGKSAASAALPVPVQSDLYKQSIQAGVLVGVIAIIIGIAATVVF